MQRSELARELERLHLESWGWALACCGRDRQLAEEALQTAYLRILSGRAKFGGASSVKTWIFGVIRWTALGELRRRRVRSVRDIDAEAAREVVDSATAPDVAAERTERRETLIKALAALSRRQREVLHLVFYHDLTIEEAAHVMRVSVGSARTHYERGKQALARKLAREALR
jgi:RNA polymerase sigma-70 factor (ECF subfamily)